MRIEKVNYFGNDYRFRYGDVETDGARITKVEPRGDEPREGCDLLLPGLIDLHLHGNSGADFSDGDLEGLTTVARFLAQVGVTSFSPASMTLPEDQLLAACRNAVRFRREAPAKAARLCGVTLEGPFFNVKKKGAQAAEYLRLPDFGLFGRLQAAAEGLIRIACVAPELPGAAAFARDVVATGVIVSAAHTEADYDQAAAGFDAGISHVTHLFNAMPPFLHRAPGVIGAASERPGVTAELITDGVHIHPSAVRAAFKLFGPERICLISDAMSATGMADGDYFLGGQPVTVRQGRATLADGTIAGSTATLIHCVRTAVSMGIPLADAVRCATANPARVIGVDDAGMIAEGLRADLLLCGGDLSLKTVFLGGEALN